MNARSLMTRNVITIHLAASTDDAMAALRDHNISGMPVVDGEGHIVGVFSLKDAIHRQGATVAEIMSSPAMVIDEEASLEEVATIMAAMNINRLPVVSEGRLTGIIARADIIRYLATMHAWRHVVE